MIKINPERRRRALLLLRHGSVSRRPLDDQIVYTVGLLIADADGRVDRDQLVAAAQDPEYCAAARKLLKEALR